MYSLNYLIDLIAIGYQIEAFYVKDDTIYDHTGHILCHECPLGISHGCMSSWKAGNAISSQLHGPYTYLCPLGLAFIILSNEHRIQCLPHDFLVVGPIALHKDGYLLGQHLRAKVSSDSGFMTKLQALPYKMEKRLSYIADGIYLAYEGTYFIGNEQKKLIDQGDQAQEREDLILKSGYSSSGLLARLESLSESLLHDASDAEGEIDKKAKQIFDIVTFEESTDTTRIQNKLGAILIYLCEKYLANTPRERDIRQVTLSKVNEIARQQTIDKIKHSFLDALQSLHRYYANSLTHSEAQLIMQFENIVASRYAEPLTLKDIAAELNVSYSFLSTLINKTLKMRFSQYLIEARLKASLQLLSNTDLPLAEIAHNVGFSDQSHFSKSFRKMYDQPPQQYRKSGMRG